MARECDNRENYDCVDCDEFFDCAAMSMNMDELDSERSDDVRIRGMS